MKKILSFKNYISEKIIIPEGSIDTKGSMDTDNIKNLIDDADDKIITDVVDYIRDILLKQERQGKIPKDTTDTLDDNFDDWKEWIKEAIDTIDFDSDELSEILNIFGGEKYESDFLADFDNDEDDEDEFDEDEFDEDNEDNEDNEDDNYKIESTASAIPESKIKELKKKIELIFNEEVLSISTENNNLYVELETGKAYGESKNVTLISGHWDGKSLKNNKYLYTKDSLTILSDNRSNKRSQYRSIPNEFKLIDTLIDLKIKPIDITITQYLD